MKYKRTLHILSNDKERKDAIFINGKEVSCQTTSSQVVSLEMIAAGKPLIWKGFIKRFFYIKGFAVRNNSDSTLKHTFSYFAKGFTPRKSRKYLVNELKLNDYSLDTETNMILKRQSLGLYILSIIYYPLCFIKK